MRPIAVCLALAGCLSDLEPPAFDADRDGYTAAQDCDDDSALVHPDAPEQCNETDDDCDGATDEEPTSNGQTFYVDADHDGYGAPDAGTSLHACAAPDGYANNDDDCEDDDASRSPDRTEMCDPQSIDEDCNGKADDAESAPWNLPGAVHWYWDYDHDTYGGSEIGSLRCHPDPTREDDQVTVDGDCDDLDPNINPSAAEVCDPAHAIDEDCDGGADDADPDGSPSGAAYYADADGDGYGAGPALGSRCEAPAGKSSDATDCDDGDKDIHPLAFEVCDSLHAIDEDCDGEVDDADPEGPVQFGTLWYADLDADGDGDATDAIMRCTGSIADRVVNGYDCDDSDAWLNSGTAWFTDADGDGFGLENSASVATQCEPVSGSADNAWDCDDTLANTHPGAKDATGDALDQDCSGMPAVPIVKGTAPLGGSPRIEGSTLGGFLGRAAVRLGDQLAVAAPSDYQANGRVYVAPAPLTGAIQAVNAPVQIYDNARGFGAALDAGDFDGDGTVDLVIGSPNFVGPGATVNAGAVYVVTRADAQFNDLNSCTVDCDVCSRVGASSSYFLGSSVAVSDVLGSEQVLTVDAFDGRGAVRVYDWEAALTGPTPSCPTGAAADWSPVEPNRGIELMVVARVGDLDQDGAQDVAAGAPNTPGLAGRVAVVLEPLDGHDMNLESEADAFYYGANADQAGSSLAGAVDLDDDGYDDLLIGAPHGATLGYGGVVVLYGRPVWPPLPTADATFLSDTQGDLTGVSVAGVGDVDGDAGDEFVIGAPGMKSSTVATGGAWLVLTPNTPRPLGTTILSVLSNARALKGQVGGDAAGQFVRGIGDLDVDGYDDFVVGAPDALSQRGALYVVYAADLY